MSRFFVSIVSSEISMQVLWDMTDQVVETDRSRSGKPEQSSGDQSRDRLDEEDPAADRGCAVDAGDHDAYEKEGEDRPPGLNAVGDQRPDEPGGKKAVVQAQVGGQGL